MKEDHSHPPSGCSISCVQTASSWGDSQTSKAKAFSFLLSVRASGTRKAGDEDLNGAYCLELCRLLLLQTQPTRAKLHVPCTGARTCGSLIPSKPAGVLMRPGQRVTFVSPPPWGRSSSGPIAGSGCPQLIWPAESVTCQRRRPGSADLVVGTQCPKGWRTVEGAVGEGQRTRAGILSPTQS